MYGLAINIRSDTATPAIAALAKGISQDKIQPVVGRSAVNTYRKHLIQWDKDNPNQISDRRTHWAAQAARSTEFQRQSGGVLIQIHHVAIAQRYLGGTIVPRNAKMLVMPASPAAYGRRPREFTDLEFGYFEHPKGGDRPGLGRGTGRQAAVMYWLFRKAKQDPDPTVLPSDKAVGDQIVDDLGRYVDLLKQRAK